MIFNIVNIVLAIMWIAIAVYLIILPLHIKRKYAKNSESIYVYYLRYVLSVVMIIMAILMIILSFRVIDQNSIDIEIFASFLMALFSIIFYKRIYHMSSFILINENTVYLGRCLNKWSLTPLKISPQDFLLNLEQYKNGGLKSEYGFGLPDVNGNLNNVWFSYLHLSKLASS